MYIQQIYTNCLSEASYYVEDQGEAVIIDPIREPEPYIALAKERGATIKYVLETHFHADFISGHIDLAEKTGATIVFGPGASTGYRIYETRDGEILRVGNCTITVLHTPGHTPESSCYLLKDEQQKEIALFSGDTLFIGDVGRPDLAVKTSLSMEELAGMLYDSLHEKILPLPDEITIYPAHGPGSACGKNIGKETFSTLGLQKQTNYALQPMNKEKFIEVVTEGILPAPNYFSIAAGINKNGYANLDVVLSRVSKGLDAHNFKKELKSGAIVLDTRTPDEFESGFISGSINIGLNGQFAIWAGTLLDYAQPLLIIAEPGKEQEAISRLSRVGIEFVKGYLNGGIAAWKAAGERVETVISLDPAEMPGYLEKGYKVLDVRKPGEFEAGHLESAENVHLQILEENLADLNKEDTYLVHCAGGYRSMIAVSMLRRNGFHNYVNVRKGWSGIKDIPSLSITQGPCEMEKKASLVDQK